MSQSLFLFLFLNFYILFFNILFYFIPYVTMLPESLCHGKEVLFMFSSAYSI